MGNTIPPTAEINDFTDNPDLKFFQSLSISSLDSIIYTSSSVSNEVSIVKKKKKLDIYENDLSEEDSDIESDEENNFYFPLSSQAPTFYTPKKDNALSTSSKTSSSELANSSLLSSDKLNYKYYYEFYANIYNNNKKLITWREYYLIFSKLKEIMNKKKKFSSKKLWHPSTLNYSMKKANNDEHAFERDLVSKKNSNKYIDEEQILNKVLSKKNNEEKEDNLIEEAFEKVLDFEKTENYEGSEDKTNQLLENFITSILSEKKSKKIKIQEVQEVQETKVEIEEVINEEKIEHNSIPDYYTENIPSEHSEYTIIDEEDPLHSVLQSKAIQAQNNISSSIPFNSHVYSPIFFGYTLETFEQEKKRQKELEKKNKSKIRRAIDNSKKLKIINLNNIENNLLKQINLRESKINMLKENYEKELAKLNSDYEAFIISVTKDNLDDEKDAKDKKKNKKRDEETDMLNNKMILLKQEKYTRDVEQLRTTFNVEYNELNVINKEKNKKDLLLINQKYKELEYFFFFDYFFLPFFNLIENISKNEITKNISIVGNHLSQLKLVQADLKLLREEKKKVLAEMNILESEKKDGIDNDDKTTKDKATYLPKFAKKLNELKSMINVTETTLNQGMKQTKESILNLYDSEALLKKSLEIKLYEESLLPLFKKLSQSKKTKSQTSTLYTSSDGLKYNVSDQSTSFNIENILLCDRELLLVSLVLITHGNFDLKINTLINIISKNYFNNNTSESAHSSLSTSLITKRFFSLNFLLKFIEVLYDVLKELNFISSLILWEDVENFVLRIFHSYQYNLNIFLITEYELKLIVYHLINRDKLLLKLFGLIPSSSSSTNESSTSSFSSSPLLSLSVYQLSHLNPLSLLVKGQTSYNSALKFIHYNQMKYYKQLNNVNKKIIHDLSMNLSPSSASSSFTSTPSPTFINYLNYFDKNNKDNFTSSFSNSSSSFYLSYFNLEPYINLRARKKKEKEKKLIQIQSRIRTYLVQVNLKKLNLLNNLLNTKNKIIKEIKEKIIKKYKKNEEELNGIQKLKWNSILKLKQNELKLMQGLNLNRNDVLVYLIEEEIMNKKILIEEKFNNIKQKYNINSFSLLTDSNSSNSNQEFNFHAIHTNYPTIFALYNELSQIELNKLYNMSMIYFYSNIDGEGDDEDDEIEIEEDNKSLNEGEEENKDEEEINDDEELVENDEDEDKSKEKDKEDEKKSSFISFFNIIVNSTRLPYQYPYEIIETFFINSYSADFIDYNSFNPLNSSSFSSLVSSHFHTFFSNSILNSSNSLNLTTFTTPFNNSNKTTTLSPSTLLNSIPLTNLKGETFLETNLRLYLMKPEVKATEEFLNRILLSSNSITRLKAERLLKLFSSKKLLLKYLSNNNNKKILLNLLNFFQFNKIKNKKFNLEKETEENILKNSYLPSFPLNPQGLEQWNYMNETGSAELAGLSGPNRIAYSSTSPNLAYSTSVSAFSGLSCPEETNHSTRISSNLFFILNSLRQIELNDLEYGILRKFGYNLQFKLENFLIQQSNQYLRSFRNKFEHNVSSRLQLINSIMEEEEEEKRANRNEATRDGNRDLMRKRGNDEQKNTENDSEKKIEQSKLEEIIVNNELKKINNNYIYYNKLYKNSMMKIKHEESNLNNLFLSINNAQELYISATQSSTLIKNYSSSFPSLVPINLRMNWNQRLESLNNYIYSANYTSCLEIIQLIESFEDTALNLSKVLINELYLKEHLRSVKFACDYSKGFSSTNLPTFSAVSPISSSSDSAASSTTFTEFLNGNNLLSGKGLGRMDEIELDEILDEEIGNIEKDDDNDGEEKTNNNNKWYESNNIFFYVSLDYEGIYHGNDEIAGKQVNLERLASEFLSSLRINHLNSTLMCTIDYFGYKILAVSRVPILHSKFNEDGIVVRNYYELSHGLSANGKKFINKNKNNAETKSILGQISEKFKLKSNFIKGKLDDEVSESPCSNLYIYKGSNNSYYLRNHKAMLVPEVNLEEHEEERKNLGLKKKLDKERKRRKEFEKNNDEKGDERLVEEIETEPETDEDEVQELKNNNYIIIEIMDTRRILNVKLTNKIRSKFKKKKTNLNSYLKLFKRKDKKDDFYDYDEIKKKIIYINRNNLLEEVTLVKIKKFYLSREINNQNYFWKSLRPEYSTNYFEKLSVDIDINLRQDLYDFYEKKKSRFQIQSDSLDNSLTKSSANQSYFSPYSSSANTFVLPENYLKQHIIELNRLNKATNNLYSNLLPNYLLKLIQNINIQPPFLNLLTNNFSLSKDLHRNGLNVRHIGFLRAICWRELSGSFNLFTNENYIKSEKNLSEEIINGDYLLIEDEIFQVYEEEKRENNFEIDKYFKDKNKEKVDTSSKRKNKEVLRCVTNSTIPISRYYKGKTKKNIRIYSGRISSTFINCNSVRLLFLGEMVSRTVKQLIRGQLRDYLKLNKLVSNNFLKNLICNHFNLLTSSSPSLNSIEYYEEILFLSIRERFGEYSLLNSERKTYQKEINSILKYVILRIASMLNIKLSSTCLINIDNKNSFNSYSSNSSTNLGLSSCLGFYFSPEDILDIEPVVKNNCPVYLFAKAMVVLKEAEESYNKNYFNTILNDKPLLFYIFNERNGTKTIKNHGILNKKYEGKIFGNYELELDGPIYYNSNIRSIYINNSNELNDEINSELNSNFDHGQSTISYIEIESDSSLIPNNTEKHFSCEIFFSVSTGKNTNRSIISSSRFQLLISRDEYITIILYDDFHTINIPLEMISDDVYANNSIFSSFRNNPSMMSNKIWYHVIITFNGTILKGFVNGQLKCEIETEIAFKRKKEQWNKKNREEFKKLLNEEKMEEKKLIHKTYQEASIYFQKKNGIAELKKMSQIILDTEENLEEDIKEEKEHEKEAKKGKKNMYRDDEIELEESPDVVITNRDKKLYALKKAKENYIKNLYDKNLIELRHKYSILKNDLKMRNERIVNEGKLKNKNSQLRIGSLLPNSNNKHGHQFFNGEFSSFSLYSYCLTDNQVNLHFIHAIRSYFYDTDRLYSLASNKFYKAIINVSTNMELYQNYLQHYAKGLCHWCDSVLSSLPSKTKKNFYQASYHHQNDGFYQDTNVNSETLLTYQNDMKNKLITASSELKNIIKHFESLSILEPLLEILKELPSNPLLASIFVDILLIIKRKDRKIFNKTLTFNKKNLVNLPFLYGITAPNLDKRYYEAASFLFQIVLKDPNLHFSYGDINLSFINEIRSPQLIIYLILHSYYDKQLKVLEFSSFFSEFSNNLPSHLGAILPLNSSSYLNEELKFNRNYFSTINSSNYSSYNLYDSVILSPLLTPTAVPSSNFSKISYKYINNFSFSYLNYKDLLKNHEGIYINLFPFDESREIEELDSNNIVEEKKLNKLENPNLNYKIIERKRESYETNYNQSSSELLLDDHDLEVLTKNLPQIEGIDLRNCTKVTNHGLKSLVKLKKLKKLILDNLYELNDEGITYIMKDLGPYLELISFSNLLLITNQTLFSIYQNCSNLVSINLSNCPLVSFDYVNLIIEKNDGLKHLYLSNINTQSEIYPEREGNMKNSSQMANSILNSSQDNLYYSPSNQLHVINSIPIPSKDPNTEKILEIYEPVVSLNKSEENLIKFSKLLYGYEIEVLDLSNLHYLSDVTLIYLTKSIKNSIKVLNLNNLPYVSSYGINYVVKSCLKLEWLNISNNSLITSDAFGDHYVGNEEMKKKYKDIEDKYDEELKKRERVHDPNIIDSTANELTPHIDNIINSYQKDLQDDTSMLTDSLNSLQQPSFSMNSSVVSLNSSNYLLKSSYNLLNMMINIEYLNVTNCDLLNDEFCYHLSYKCFRIKYLILRGCSNITDVGISYFYSSPNITNNINNNSFMSSTNNFFSENKNESNINPSFCSSLIHIDLSFLTSLTAKNVLNFLRFCVNLESLELTGLATIVTDEFMNYLCQFNSKKIKKLVLNHNKQLNNLSLFYISKYFASLEHLEIVDCPKINNNGLEIFSKENKTLKYLNILRLPLITKKSIYFIKKINPNIIIRCDEEIFHSAK